MKALEGIFLFIIMIILSISMSIWMVLTVFNTTILSPNENKIFIEQADFSQISNKIESIDLNKTNTFIKESSIGIMNYITLETRELPTVEVSFFKDYMNNKIENKIVNILEDDIEISDLIKTLRSIPKEDISEASYTFFSEVEFKISNKQIDMVIDTYINNLETSDEELENKIINLVVEEVVDLDEIETEIHLQEIINKSIKEDPFLIIRKTVELFRKDLNNYLIIVIVLLIFIIILTSFRVGEVAIWFFFVSLFAIIPVQLIRLSGIVLKSNTVEKVDVVSKYLEFMIEKSIDKANVFTIIMGVFIILMVALKISSSIIKKRNNNKTDHKKKLEVLRVVLILGLLGGLYLSVSTAYKENLSFYNSLQSYEISDFDIANPDDIILDVFNIDMDY